MDKKEQREGDFEQSHLEIIKKAIEDIQINLGSISPDQLMQELETIKMWISNIEDE